MPSRSRGEVPRSSMYPRKFTVASILSHTTTRRFTLIALILALSYRGATVFAYDTSLDPGTIQAAYELGQRNDRMTGDFLARYFDQRTEEAADGLHRADIELLTPFVQILDRARDNSRPYSLQQAMKEYRERGDSIIIRISLLLPANYPAPNNPTATACDNTALQPQNFWNNFAFLVRQRGKVVAPRSIKNEPIYSSPSKNIPPRLDGANVQMEFDAKNIASEQLIVDILTPRCKTITAKFDLSSLR